MSGLPRLESAEPLDVGLLSVLRHDLVTPINLIVGYCELLIAESADLGMTARVAPLQSIRQAGYHLLGSIDQTLLTSDERRYPADVKELAEKLTTPATNLVSACAELVDSTQADPDGQTLASDLEKIRLAADRLRSIAQEMRLGWLPEPNQAQT